MRTKPEAQRAAWTGLILAGLLVALAFALPHLLDWNVHTRTRQSPAPAPVTPPLHGWWEPKWWGPGTLPAVAIALLGWRYAAELATRLPWRRLLLTSYAVGAAWLIALASVDGADGLGRVLGYSSEYLPTARTFDLGMLGGFIDRIPVTADDNWPIHVAGHPPGALLFFVALVRVGLGADLAAGFVVIAIAATIPLAVLTVLRTLGSEDVARRAAPFLVLTPAAVFLAVSADAVFAAVGCWAAAALALATRADAERRRPALVGWGGLSGVLLGYGMFLSYGFGLLGGVALAVLVAARSWRPVLVLLPAALAVVLGFVLAGFVWWQAYPVLVERYWAGIASDRPASYWWWGNLAALLVSAGPLVGAGLADTAGSMRTSPRAPLLLVAGGALGVVAADVSGMSRSEVERIWLIFVPWLTVSLALLPDGWRRWGLGLQVVTALTVQHLLHNSW